MRISGLQSAYSNEEANQDLQKQKRIGDTKLAKDATRK